jgi:RNA polymerase sigma-70 factor (ECF subfamily)
MDAEERDRAWVEECLGGNTQAFGSLVDAYQGLLFNIALRMVNDPDEAKDILQTAFLKAYQRLDSYDPRYKFFSWMYRIVINESLNQKGRRRRVTELDREMAGPEPDPETSLTATEMGELVKSAVIRLSPEYREVIVLRHFANMSYRDMSTVLEVPEKTVKSRLYTARRRMAEILLHEGVTST